MKRGEHKAMQMQNMQRLRNLALPTDLFSEGFRERDAVAKQRELIQLTAFERYWREGKWAELSLPFEQIIERWRASIANPMHFTSIGPKPRWVPLLSNTGRDWRRERTGAYRKSWRDYRRKQIAKKREAQGKPTSKWKL